MCVESVDTLFDLYVFIENCTEGDFRQQPRGEGNGIFIQYCSGKSWYYLCGGSVGLSPPEAAVVCRQLGYSDQGEGVPCTFIAILITMIVVV